LVSGLKSLNRMEILSGSGFMEGAKGILYINNI